MYLLVHMSLCTFNCHVITSEDLHTCQQNHDEGMFHPTIPPGTFEQQPSYLFSPHSLTITALFAFFRFYH